MNATTAVLNVNRVKSDVEALSAAATNSPKRGVQSVVNTVLVIEDDFDVNRLVSRCLRADGLRVISAQDGEDGIRAAIAQRPDMIVLDLLLPCVDGFSVLNLLFSLPSTRGIPVVVLTGVDDHSTESHARQWTNVLRFVRKPIKAHEVSRIVSDILDRPDDRRS